MAFLLTVLVDRSHRGESGHKRDTWDKQASKFGSTGSVGPGVVARSLVGRDGTLPAARREEKAFCNRSVGPKVAAHPSHPHSLCVRLKAAATRRPS